MTSKRAIGIYAGTFFASVLVLSSLDLVMDLRATFWEFVLLSLVTGFVALSWKSRDERRRAAI